MYICSRFGATRRISLLYFRGTAAAGKAPAFPRLSMNLNKARWGREGGLGGKGNTSRASRGVSLPPKNIYFSSLACSGREASGHQWTARLQSRSISPAEAILSSLLYWRTASWL